MNAEFPFIGSAGTNTTVSLDVFREWAWDFGKDCFRLDGDGNMILLSGNDALAVWIYHAMKVERWAYLAYSFDYGVEFRPLIGKVLTAGERRSELERTIRESLLVNPYIRSVDSIQIKQNGVRVEIEVSVSTVYGSLTI